MDLQELVTKYELNEECVGELEKIIQSSTDKVRTEYTLKLKEAEKFKPVEKSDIEVELENTKKELESIRFQKSLKDIGVSDDMTKFLRSDIDISEFGKFYEGFNKQTQKKDFVAKNHGEDVGMTKQDFSKMNYSQRTELYNTNPTLYAELTKS